MQTLFQLEKTKLVDVAIPLPVEDPFSYEVPEDMLEQIQPGIRVRVPFKNREIIGYVVGSREEVPTPKTKKMIHVLEDEPILSAHHLALSAWIRDYYGSSWGEAIQCVIPKPHQRERKNESTSDVMTDTKELPKKIIRLNEEQKTAVDQITRMLHSGQHETALIFGVTGSGKSELYIRAIQETLKLKKSAICLVPEIALTEQLKRFFETHFADTLEIVHSKLSEGARWWAWERLRKGEKRVVLGARSAIFSPVRDLGLIVIDEEQEPSYKQDQTPRYHAREVARWRAKESQATLLLGSATPCMETMHEAKENKIHTIELKKRVDSKKLPEIEIVDLNQAQAIAKGRVVISPKLQAAIQTALDRHDGILLLLNRRGFSTFTQCLHCKEPILCKFCDVALTYHQAAREMLCHYCNFKIKDPDVCPRCKQSLLKFSGIGTERVESETARFFPGARIARLDSDTARRKGSHEKILKSFRERQIDILVGTQMIAKGFDFPHVTLVGVVLADTALVLPDFRSSERTFQLLTQVAGRSGRGEREGKVIIQTYSPFHYSIQLAKQHAVSRFFEKEVEQRRNFDYPPFVKLINLMFRGKIEKRVIEQATDFKKAFLELPVGDTGTELIGPAPLPFHKLRGHYRWHILLKSQMATDGLAINKYIRAALKQVKRSAHVRIAMDVDPLTIL